MQFNFNGADFVVLFDADVSNQASLGLLCHMLFARKRAKLVACGNDSGRSLQKLRAWLSEHDKDVAQMLHEIEAPTKPEAADAILIVALLTALQAPNIQGIAFVTHDRKLYEMAWRQIEMYGKQVEMHGGKRAAAFLIPSAAAAAPKTPEKAKDAKPSHTASGTNKADAVQPVAAIENTKADSKPSDAAIEAVEAWRLAHPKNFGKVPETAIESLSNKTKISPEELRAADQLLLSQRATDPAAQA